MEKLKISVRIFQIFFKWQNLKLEHVPKHFEIIFF